MITPVQSYKPINSGISSQPLKPQVNSSVSFGKGYSQILEDIFQFSKGYDKLSKAKPIQKIVEFLSKRNAFTHLLVADSALISSTYMISTLKNKKIPKDQKPAMLTNDALVWAFSTASTYLLDSKLNNLTEKTIDRFVKANKSNTQIIDNIGDYVSGIKNIKSIIIAGFIYRYVGPVIMTPIANKISKTFLDKKNEAKTENK